MLPRKLVLHRRVVLIRDGRLHIGIPNPEEGLSVASISQAQRKRPPSRTRNAIRCIGQRERKAV